MPAETIITILIVVGVIFAIASVIYGVFRKFTQMSWLSYQIPLVFLIVALLDLLPAKADPFWRLLLSLLVLIGATVLIVGGGALLRGAMHKKRMPAHPAWQVTDRLLGGITALWDYLMIVAVLGGAALSFIYFVLYGSPVWDAVGGFFELGIWTDFLAHHILDLLLVTVFVFAMRGGWRVGFGRVFIIVIMLALSIGSLALGIYLALAVPFFSGMADGIAAGFAGISPAVGKIIGTAIIGFVLFLIFFVICCILGFFMVKLMRHIRYDYFWGTFDAVFGCALSLIVMLAIVIGLNIAVAALAQGVLSQFVQQIMQTLGENGASLQPVADFITGLDGWFQSIGAWLSSAPLARALYANPFYTPMPLA